MIYNIVYNSWNIDYDSGFFANQQSSGSWENGINQKSEIEKIRKKKTPVKKRWKFVWKFTWGCTYVSVCGCVHIHVCVIVTYWCVFFFLIFDLFHFLNCLMIVVLQKTQWNPGSQSIFHELYIYTLAQRLECSPMAREIWVQSQVESYQRL